jgi:hypothetical protein
MVFYVAQPGNHLVSRNDIGGDEMMLLSFDDYSSNLSDSVPTDDRTATSCDCIVFPDYDV